MRHLITLIEKASSKTLYHGTIIDFVQGIEDADLQPSVGDLVKTMYGEYEDEGIEVPELVFAADREGLKSCVAAMGHLIKKHYGLSPSQAYGPEAIGKYGALCVITDVGGFRHRPRDGQEDYDDHPTSAEPGDYYSEYSVAVSKILTGKPLVTFLTKNFPGFGQ